MFPFAFEKECIEQPPTKLDETALLSSLLLTILQNQRLTLQLNSHQSEEVSFSLRRGDFNREQEYQLQIELKQVKIDNLTALLREMQAQAASGEKERQEALHRCTVLEMNAKQDIAELRTQLMHYKTKYEEEAANCKRSNKMETQFKMSKLELEGRNKELTMRMAQLQSQLSKSEKSRELFAMQNQKRCKQLRMQVEVLRSDLTNKQQECFSLKASLNDCPKIEQLNRWIGKVKEYEEKQMQACGKMSQMSQELCTSREKLRKLENQYRQLQKIKQELETALTENKGNEDSMVIYFDRLETYEKVIKDLEEEIRKMEADRKNEEKTHQAKVDSLQKEKDAVVAQWKAIVQQMNKQKAILVSMQKQVEKYQSYITDQSERQNEIARNEQMNQMNHQKAMEVQRMRAVQEERRGQEMRYEPYSFIDNSKCSERSNRSLSLQNKRTDFRAETENESTNIMQSQLVCEPSRQLRANSAIGRAASEQRIIYHSDAHSHSRNSTSRMNTQSSTGCGECMSRVHDGRNDFSNRSLPLQQNRLQEARNEMGAQITDEKKLLMEKLNILKPQDPNLALRADRNISSLYSKNYRQVNPSSQNILKLNANNGPKQTAYQASSHRLQLGRVREEKQNLNDMIVKRYANLMQRP